MKRSEINAIIDDSIAFMRKHRFALPPFAFWTPAQWTRKGREADEIRDCMLGWDITDFGLGDFRKTGLVLFTLRNGHPTHPRYAVKTYCEKIMIQDVDQVTPMHFHWSKAEDIINRGGGELVIRLYNATKTDGLAKTPVTLWVDGLRRTIKAGGLLVLKPGESVTLTSRIYHAFWGRTDKVLVGEVSKVNDDKHDNRFLEPLGRFPGIEEDEKARHLLCSEYPRR